MNTRDIVAVQLREPLCSTFSLDAKPQHLLFADKPGETFDVSDGMLRFLQDGVCRISLPLSNVVACISSAYAEQLAEKLESRKLSAARSRGA